MERRARQACTCSHEASSAGEDGGEEDNEEADCEETRDMPKDLSIRDVPLVALQCRDNRCEWERERKHDVREPLWGTYRWDLCVRCENWRCRIECSDGRVLSETTSYEYSAAYEFALQFTREDCRLELNRRDRAASKPKTVVVRGGRGRANLRAVS